MQSGRGGMGSHKHFFSGTPGKNGRYKQSILRDEREKEHKVRLRKLKRSSSLYSSVFEALKYK